METPHEMVAGTLTAGGARPLAAQRLVEEAQAFSDDAWGQIYDEYYVRIVDYCYLRVGNRTVAEDLASDVFVEALKGIGRYQYRGVPLSAWLYRIARNVSADYLKRSARRPTVPLLEEGDNPRLQSIDEAAKSDLWHDMQQAIKQLTEDQQQVIILRFFQDLSHEETATIMDRRPGAVRVLQSRALDALRRQMPA